MHPACPICGSADTVFGGYDRDDAGRLAHTWQCLRCDDCWNTPAPEGAILTEREQRRA